MGSKLQPPHQLTSGRRSAAARRTAPGPARVETTVRLLSGRPLPPRVSDQRHQDPEVPGSGPPVAEAEKAASEPFSTESKETVTPAGKTALMLCKEQGILASLHRRRQQNHRPFPGQPRAPRKEHRPPKILRSPGGQQGQPDWDPVVLHPTGSRRGCFRLQMPGEDHFEGSGASRLRSGPTRPRSGKTARPPGGHVSRECHFISADVL
ncbi:unnamed protein product [Rangifer tarandus platyrhynchus]|uniref:Uncharacterized protein n=1 Tax=Rangifer tarandus platyrhynchus TaxID=3082113 RepID=A0AC59YF79_RANTA